MKQTKHLLGMAAALLLAASCSSDEPVDPKPQVADKDQTRYLSVAISSPAGTRAYEDGTAEESQIDNIVFCFYDLGGNFIAKTTPIADGNVTDDFNNDNTSRIWSKVVAVDLTQGQNLPAYVMAFVNPTDQTAIFDGLSLKEIEQKYIYTSLNSAEHGFPMSNSVYYGHNPFTGQTEKMMATPVTNNQLYDSMDKAQSAIDNDEVLTIHVERYSAKIGLSIAADAIKDYEELKTADGTAVKLQFVPEYWRPNAVSKTSYQTKKFALSETEGVAAYKDVVDRFKNTGMADSWNNETDHRSFWGCSPSFYKNDYPNVSDDVLDVDDPDAVETDYAVKYFSYNGIKNGVAGSANAPAFDAGSDKFGTTPAYFYSRETTTFIDAINNVETGNPVASVASVVIVGKYLVDDATDAATFYVDHNTYYPSEAEAAAALIARQNLLYTYNDATDQYAKATDADYFNVEHPKAAVRGKTPVAGRYVTLQLKGATADGLPALHFYDGTHYVAVDATNLDEVNRRLWQNVHTMEVYNNGRAFFNIPIRHLGYGQNVDPTKPLEEDGSYMWENMRRGDFGVVRNHVYTLNVKTIKGRATGLRSDDQPIVPQKDAINYYVSAKLNVLAWNIVPTQHVDL